MAALRSSLRHSTRFSTSTSTSTSAATITIPSALKSLFPRDKSPDKALEAYNSISGKDISPLDPLSALAYTVKLLAKSHRFDDIEALIESHKKSPQITDERFVSSLIRSYGEAKMPDQALRLFEEMKDLGATRSTLSFNALLFSHIKSKKYDEVKKLFDEIPQRYSVTPDSISYSNLIRAICGLLTPDKCLPILKEMGEKNIEVTSHTYTSLAHTFYRQGKDIEAGKIWKKMTEKGFKLDVVAYNVRVKHARDGEPSVVLGLIEEMKAAGLKPDIYTYNDLLTCYFNKGMVKEALKVYGDLEANGCVPNGETFNLLVSHFCKKGDYVKAYGFLKESEKREKVQPINIMRYLVQGLLKKSKMEEAKELIGKVRKSPNGVPENWNEFLVEHGLESASA